LACVEFRDEIFVTTNIGIGAVGPILYCLGLLLYVGVVGAAVRPWIGTVTLWARPMS
jgi:hypothetical protein